MFFISGNHAPCYVLQDFIKISDPNKTYSYFLKSVIAKLSFSSRSPSQMGTDGIMKIK